MRTQIATIPCDRLNRELINEVDELYNRLDYIQITVKTAEPNEDNTSPMPWDATLDLSADGDTLIINGGAGPSGFGTAVVTLPLKSSSHYELEVENFNGPPIPISLWEVSKEWKAADLKMWEMVEKMTIAEDVNDDDVKTALRYLFTVRSQAEFDSLSDEGQSIVREWERLYGANLNMETEDNYI